MGIPTTTSQAGQVGQLGTAQCDGAGMLCVCLCVLLPRARPGLWVGKAEEEQIAVVPEVPGQGGTGGGSCTCAL